MCEGWVRRRPAAQAQVRRRRRAPVPELMVSIQFLMILCVLCVHPPGPGGRLPVEHPQLVVDRVRRHLRRRYRRLRWV